MVCEVSLRCAERNTVVRIDGSGARWTGKAVVEVPTLMFMTKAV